MQTIKPGLLSQTLRLIKKDLALELRTHEMVTSMLVYAVLVLTVYGAALSQTSDTFDIQSMASGLLWALIVFTALLGLNRSFNAELEASGLEGLLVAPVDRGALFLSKTLSNMMFIVVVELIVTPLFYLFFLSSVPLNMSFLLIVIVLVVGTFGVSGIGSLLATITIKTRSKDVLLAVLLIPLIFPLLHASVCATSALLAPAGIDFALFWRCVGIALGYDVIMVAVCFALYEFVVGA